MQANRALIPVLSFIVAGALGTEAWAQERQQFSFTPPLGTSKYEEQHVKVKESWLRAMSDYTNLNGHVNGYYVYAMENGDKVYARWEGLTQTTISPDGSKASEVWGVTTLTGGTGKFKGIRGTLHGSSKVDWKGSANPSSPTVGEYWFEQ